MKNENKCFFSISLENGIVITGENPKMVKDFLLDMTLCVGDAIEHTQPNGWNKYLKKLKVTLDTAWNTIYNNMKG